MEKADKTTYIREQIKRTIHEVDPKAEVILFGSRARKEANKESDWDILILTSYPTGLKEEQKFRHHLFDLELEVEEAFSVMVISKEDWENKYKVIPLYENVQNEGIRL